MAKEKTPKGSIASQLKSTVRRRPRNKKTATQRYVPISEIRNDTVLLKKGGMRAVIEVEALNFNLKSETEQQGIIAGYEAFINTITFPLQIVTRSTKVNIDPYIEQMRGHAAKQENDLLREQTESYADFIEKIVEVADIMQKRFLVVVPLDDEEHKRSTLSQFFSWIGMDDSASKVNLRRKYFGEKSAKLKDRVNLVEAGLHNIGLMTRRLKTHELLELYYQIYNPKTSQEQKFPEDMNTEGGLVL